MKVERVSEAPNLSVMLLQAEKVMWKEQLSTSPDDGVNVLWSQDSNAFSVEHSGKKERVLYNERYGKIYSTALCCLMLENYYRYLPTFRSASDTPKSDDKPADTEVEVRVP